MSLKVIGPGKCYCVDLKGSEVVFKDGRILAYAYFVTRLLRLNLKKSNTVRFNYRVKGAGNSTYTPNIRTENIHNYPGITNLNIL